MALKLRVVMSGMAMAVAGLMMLRGAHADEASPWPSSAQHMVDASVPDVLPSSASAPQSEHATVEGDAGSPATASTAPATPTPPPPVGASADQPTTVILATESAASRAREATRSRFHTLAELELGILALPFAPISPAQRGGDTFIGRIGRGDATILAGIRVLASTGKRWSIGAAARFAPKPTADSEYGGAGRLPRTHSRSYFSLGAEGRFIPLQFGDFDIWGGGSIGAVIIADRFSTDSGDAVPTVLGDRNVTIATEGLSLGGQVGLHWNFADRWVMGTALRFDNWFLPKASSCTPIGDCTTLQGGVLALDLGLTIGYRVPL